MRPMAAVLVAVLFAACAPAVTPGSGGGAAKVVVELSEMKFTPSTIEVPSGRQVTLELRNRGSLEHDLVINALNVHSRHLSKGEFQSLTVGPLPAGTAHEVYCSIPGHRQAGMVGRLVVR